MTVLETREVFLPDVVLKHCLPEWETAEDEVLSQAVGEAMEHAYWHWRWVMAIREHRCRLVVVQASDADGKEMDVHYQLGDLFTLSGWHPERALVEAQGLLAEASDGLSFDLPVDAEMLAEWDQLAAVHDIEEENKLEVMASAMVLMDAAHDDYVEDLGPDFYIATRGLERDVRLLTGEEAGQWSLSTPTIIDRVATVNDVHVHTEPSGDPRKPVAVVYAPEVEDEEGAEV
ncbi:MAG: hypothetical protein H6922_04745 [Pseudomonadaceae bacterium]|nr:hypothetical protein [Pseudomonadaceae bacterium]